MAAQETHAVPRPGCTTRTSPVLTRELFLLRALRGRAAHPGVNSNETEHVAGCSRAISGASWS
jgi:hypothetical protein